MTYKKPAFFDVDDTLILWNVSEYQELADTAITVKFGGYDTVLIPHQKNINLLKKFAKLGYDVIVWSQTGNEWAKTIVKALKLQNFVKATMSKPNFYIDDIPCSEWMGTRVWRDPKDNTSKWAKYDKEISE